MIKNAKLGGSDFSTPSDRVKPTDLNDTFDACALGIVPIGSVISWLKSYTNTPSLPDSFVECNGQTLSDSDSVYDGQTIPDLNGDNRFLRGNSESGATGGSETMAHTHTVSNTGERVDSYTGGTPNWVQAQTTSGASNTENRPPFYNVVWIMRIK